MKPRAILTALPFVIMFAAAGAACVNGNADCIPFAADAGVFADAADMPSGDVLTTCDVNGVPSPGGGVVNGGGGVTSGGYTTGSSGGYGGAFTTTASSSSTSGLTTTGGFTTSSSGFVSSSSGFVASSASAGSGI